MLEAASPSVASCFHVEESKVASCSPPHLPGESHSSHWWVGEKGTRQKWLGYIQGHTLICLPKERMHFGPLGKPQGKLCGENLSQKRGW